MPEPDRLPIRTRSLSLRELRLFLPTILDVVSFSAGSRLMQQIANAELDGNEAELVTIGAYSEKNIETLDAIVVCSPLSSGENSQADSQSGPQSTYASEVVAPIKRLHAASSSDGRPTGKAAILYCGEFPTSRIKSRRLIADALRKHLTVALKARDIGQVIWRTEARPVQTDNHPAGHDSSRILTNEQRKPAESEWTPDDLCFRFVANVQHMESSFPFRPTEGHTTASPASDTLQQQPSSETPSRAIINSMAKPINWSSPEEWKTLVETVRQTYESSEDCPTIDGVSTAEETLSEYLANPYFDPNAWFLITQSSNNPPIGCLILETIPERLHPHVLEIVYLGLVPSARGHGFGRQLLEHASSYANTLGRKRLLAAVDQKNIAALRLYKAAGFLKTDTESIWLLELK